MKIYSTLIIALFSFGTLFAEAWSSANPERYNKMGFDNALWVETFEGNEKPFTVEYIGGAEGTAKVVDNGGRNGRKAMHIVKTNDKGYMVIRFNKPIKVKAGDKLQLNCFYQGKNADFGYSRALLRTLKRKRLIVSLQKTSHVWDEIILRLVIILKRFSQATAFDISPSVITSILTEGKVISLRL